MLLSTNEQFIPRLKAGDFLLIQVKALKTLMYSWGGDTPPEAIWTANELLEWYEKEYNVTLNIRFEEEASLDDDGEDTCDKVRKAIEEN